MTYVDGLPLPERSLADPGAVLALLLPHHQVRGSAFGRPGALAAGTGFTEWTDHLRDRIVHYREVLHRDEANTDGAGRVGLAVLDRLEQVVPDLRVAEPTLCHNDIKPANLLQTGDGVVAVDWEHSVFADVLFDLAKATWATPDVDPTSVPTLVERAAVGGPEDVARHFGAYRALHQVGALIGSVLSVDSHATATRRRALAMLRTLHGVGRW
jgi:aminoglycoside phosphotransferase (APT) family kinase protein